MREIQTMTNESGTAAQSFGGAWTERKLDAIKRYLDAYTTALKKQSFKLIYIDLFAGTGSVTPKTGIDYPLDGSARVALKVDSKPFDKFIFAETDPNNVQELKKLQDKYPDRDIEIYREDGNTVLANINLNPATMRGVVFLDPFGTQIKYATIQRIANIKCLDTWILFPVSAVARMMPKYGESNFPHQLTDLFGNEKWRDAYGDQQTFEGDPISVRDRRLVDRIVMLYKKQLQKSFGKRYLNASLTLKNSRKTPLFELLFCTGSSNERAIKISHNIAKYIINYEKNDRAQMHSTGQQTFSIV